MDDFLTGILGGIGGSAIILGILAFFGRHYAEKRIDQRFSERLETHKHRLELEAESIRHDFQRRIHDFSLFAQTRHEAYRAIFEKLLEASGQIHACMGGISWKLSFEEAGKDDFESYLRDHVEMKEKVRSLLSLWDEDRQRAVDEADTYIEQMKKPAARHAYTKQRTR